MDNKEPGILDTIKNGFAIYGFSTLIANLTTLPDHQKKQIQDMIESKDNEAEYYADEYEYDADYNEAEYEYKQPKSVSPSRSEYRSTQPRTEYRQNQPRSEARQPRSRSHEPRGDRQQPRSEARSRPGNEYRYESPQAEYRKYRNEE